MSRIHFYAFAGRWCTWIDFVSFRLNVGEMSEIASRHTQIETKRRAKIEIDCAENQFRCGNQTTSIISRSSIQSSSHFSRVHLRNSDLTNRCTKYSYFDLCRVMCLGDVKRKGVWIAYSTHENSFVSVIMVTDDFIISQLMIYRGVYGYGLRAKTKTNLFRICVNRWIVWNAISHRQKSLEIMSNEMENIELTVPIA